MRFSRCTDK